jgi:ATP-binding protein involved in chromosome partitioning
MVTVPSDVSRGVVARSLSALAGTPARLLGYVENMAGYFCPECDAIRPLFPEPTVALDAPCLGRLPFDPALAELCDRGWPAGSKAEETSEAFRQVQHIARRIQEALKRPAGTKPPRSVKRPVSAPAGAGGGPEIPEPEEITR